EASLYKATDIHFIPKKDDAMIRFRIDGDVLLYQVITKELYYRLLSYFKFLASMDIGEKRKPQDGTLMIQVHQYYLQLRLSTLPSHSDESLVIRIHSQDKQVPLENLSLFPH